MVISTLDAGRDIWLSCTDWMEGALLLVLDASAVLGLGRLLRLPPLIRFWPPGAPVRNCFSARVAFARRSCPADNIRQPPPNFIRKEFSEEFPAASNDMDSNSFLSILRYINTFFLWIY